VPKSSVADSHRTPFGVYLLGFGITGVFYATAPFVPGTESFVRRYFCSHPIEIASTLLFFSGMTILLHRLWRMRGEWSAATAIESAAANDEQVQPEALTEWCEAQPARWQSCAMIERIGGAVRYVSGSGREGLEQHLRYLAELAADRLHESYALVRTITWAIPILGFLGTVHGITIAIANLTPEQLDTSLPEVVGGLEAAFDTTALALAMSIVLVFTAFKTERSEQEILNTVERFGINPNGTNSASSYRPRGPTRSMTTSQCWPIILNLKLIRLLKTIETLLSRRMRFLPEPCRKVRRPMPKP